ncbi:MAG: AzlD domain-containing protein [Desulfobacterales bacterium]|jgi:branched-subunit amino acid transport protein|nr:AzlD domain-containing protein [Desulfobacteraceae bacterium]MDD3993567.1 AzlD domain-containing protein [Desulfobacteraceae bacterium]MDY0312225.1 AzlD domain-containing protein [Desulfobacterales bacterium]
MSTASMILLLMVVGGATYLFRYSMIGLFANRNLPTWLKEMCSYIAPASFAALTVSALFIHGGEVSFALDAPKPWAALIAAVVAWRTGSVFATIGVGMASMYLLKLLF